ncbi:unnamed protein product, partial [Cladocopium goreaui]
MWHGHACRVCGPTHTVMVSSSWPFLCPHFFAIPKPNGGDDVAVPTKVHGFDRYDVAERCKELMRRLSASSGSSPQWKWDILELMEESHHQLRDIRQVHSDPDRGIWQELQGAVGNEHTASTLPVSLRKQCEEILERRKIWLGDFDTELNATLARGKEV